MEKSINERIFNLMLNGSSGIRREICKDEPMYFAIYYFPEYFDYKIPPFHYDFYSDIKDLASGKLNEAAWITFRDSAKTSIAKIAFVTWLICFKKRSYITWDSSDGGNSEQALFDVTVALQSNKKLIQDFGQLYHKRPEKEALSEAKMKRITKFITENGVKVEASSALKSTRGHLKANERPDCYVLDDLENAITAASYPITAKIKRHYDELKSGLPAYACVLVLGNYITEEGVVAHIMEKVKNNPQGRLRFIPVVDKEGNISWPDKYTKTDEERDRLNATIQNPKKWKISLEAREKDLGKASYQAEMMNNPAHGQDKVFDRETIEFLMKNARDPIKTVAGLKIWAEYRPDHRYGIGADTAKGIGRDSNASAVIDFSTMPNRVVATYKNNLIAPDTFSFELRNQGQMYGECLIAPENNETGHATITQLKQIYPHTRIYVPIQTEKVDEKIAPDFGFNSNSATVPEIIYQFKKAVEDGLLVIYDKDLLEELKYFGQRDLNTIKLVEGMTRHFDLLRATAIAWHLRSHAKLSTQIKKKPIQSQHIPAAGEYGG